MRNRSSRIGLALILTCGAAAQTPVIRVWPGVAPGSENWQQPEGVIKGTDTDRVVNVVSPTLTVYLPEKNKATGTGVIIAPGGGFVHLAIDKEGHRVAAWLKERGIAGFVLKYRVRQRTPEEIEAAAARMAGRTPPATTTPAPPPRTSMEDIAQLGIADGIQALRILRERAREFGLAPDRIGIMGFSAGGMVTAGVLLQDKPSFAAPIYGAPFGAMPDVPRNLPPVFLAWAQDDRVAAPACARFYDALKAAGSAPEVHIYGSGGHGFGMSKQGSSSDHWIEEFYYWLEAQGFAKQGK